MTRERSNLLIHSLVRANAERFDALERQGFKLVRFGDFFHHQTERQGGHYVDIGTSAKIADGRVRGPLACRPLPHSLDMCASTDAKLTNLLPIDQGQV